MAVLRGSSNFFQEKLQAVVYRSTPQVIADPLDSAIVLFDTIVLNENSQYNASTGKFTASKDGWYEVHAMVTLSVGGTSTVNQIFVMKNTTSTMGKSNVFSLVDDINRLTINSVAYLNSGDTLHILQATTRDIGATISIYGDVDYSTKMYVSYLGV